MGKKDKGADKGAEEKPEVSYEDKKRFLSVIAKPLADEKLYKKILKLSKKAAKGKQIKRGVKEVVKALRKNVKGCAAAAAPIALQPLPGAARPSRPPSPPPHRSICLLAGDISPVDVITHIPVVCEDLNIPYIYVPSKEASPGVLLAPPARRTPRPPCCAALPCT
jgi:H/ACA ribonucleoprotein complex subunit 2